ncbi:MAG TPA: Crp/Fnr family transcriptional regulator [Rhodanobacteraceae bacterium]|nr:Crp/Fnr family transcriptional regulator [Rhodanobacteraceae bacterium]
MSLPRHHPLFSALNDAQWSALQPHLHGIELSPHQRLFAQGDRAKAFFIVQSGTVKLFRLSSQGQVKIMRAVSSGQSFADSILFMEPPRYPVHAEAIENCSLVAIEREAYLHALEQSYETCRVLMTRMTQRILAHWDEIENLSMHGSVQRLARYLLSAAPRPHTAEVRLPLAKSQIAAQLGLAPETLSRGLRTLSRSNAIAVQGAQVRVLDYTVLRQIADS